MKKSGSSSASRGAFCALEVLMILAVLGVALVPVLKLSRTSVRETNVATLSYLAHARVQTLLDAQEAMGWEPLSRVNPDPQLLPVPRSAGQRPLELVGPAAAAYEERVEARQLDRDLVMLAAEVSWQPACPGGKKTVRSVRVLARPDASWLVPVPLDLETIPNPAVTD